MQLSVAKNQLPAIKPDPGEYYLDYTWLIAGVLYQGGTDLLIPELMKRGNNEIYFYNVAGSPIGQRWCQQIKPIILSTLFTDFASYQYLVMA